MKAGHVPMTYEEHVAHFLRLAEGDDGSPVTPPGTPPARELLPHEQADLEVALDEAAEDERCGRLIT